jgi:hypothetical protein
MKTRLAIAVGLLLYSVSVAEATPIRGYFDGVITFTANPYGLSFPEGTPARAIFGYDTNYLSPPDVFGNRGPVLDGDPVLEGKSGGFFQFWIADVGFGCISHWCSGYFGIGPTGLPTVGSGAGPYDFFVSSNGFSIVELALDSSHIILNVEGTYRLPDHEATLPLTVLGLVVVGLARRFL